MKQNSIFYTRHTVDKRDIAAVVKILKGDRLTQGSIVDEFELQIAGFCGVRYAVAVNSGTSALHLATCAAGIGEGDEVITTPFSFAASANCIVYQKGTPIFADINYETGLLDPKEVERKITRRTKAVITVDYAGHPSYFSELIALCRKHNLVLINDACHSLGATWRTKPIGAQADITVFSFHPAKAITTGEGGMMVTNSERFYKPAILMRSHGISKEPEDFIYKKNRHQPWYMEMQELGYNYRITDVQCALGISQLKKIQTFLKQRRDIAGYYTERLRGNPRFVVPIELPGCQSAWHIYPLRIREENISKEAVFAVFQKKNIFPQVHFIPIHLHPYYRRKFGYRIGDFPKAEKFYEEEISLPLYPTLTQKDLSRVLDVLEDL